VKIDLDALAQRAVTLVRAGNNDEAWNLIEPVAHEAPAHHAIAAAWLALSDRERDPDRRAHLAAQILSAFHDQSPIVIDAADALITAAEERPFDEAPLADGPAQLAATRSASS